WFLVRGQIALRGVDDLLLGCGLPGLEHHHCLDDLTPFVVGNADHGAFEHGGMCTDRFLHLDAVDVLATGDDHVLRTVDDVDVAFLVPDGDVARPHPAVP